MRRRVIATGAAIVQIHVRLVDVEPAVWRRIQIPAAATLAELHEVLQPAMGWTNSHLHEFRTETDRIGVPDPEWDDEDEVRDEATVLVGEVATLGTRLRYVYDFGDNWRHDLTVELIEVARPGVRYPRCLDGAGACPPEDVGGPGGYEDFLDALRDPRHERHEQAVGWGAGFDPKPLRGRRRSTGPWHGSRGRTQWRAPPPSRPPGRGRRRRPHCGWWTTPPSRRRRRSRCAVPASC